MENKKSIIIFVLLFFMGIVVGIVGYYVYDKLSNDKDVVSNNNYNEADDVGVNNDDSSNANKKIMWEIRENREVDKVTNGLYINNKLVEFEKWPSSAWLNYDVVEFNDDILIVEVSMSSGSLYVVNSNAEVIGVFSQSENDYYKQIKILPTMANYRDTYRIDGNSIYIQTDKFGNGGDDYTVCKMITDDNEVVIYEEKFEYLGNDQFSKPVVTKIVTRKQYMDERNINCEIFN